MIRLTLLIAAMVLFPFSYGICDHFFYSAMNKWDCLRHCLYMANIAVACLAFTFESDPRYKNAEYVILCAGIWWMIIPSLIGRVAGEKEVTALDIISIFIGLIHGYYKVFKNGKQRA